MKIYITSALIFLTLFATPPTATAQGIEWETLRTEMSTLFKKGEIDRAVLVGMQTIEIAEKASGAEHPSVALSLSSVGVIHNLSGKYAKALPLFDRALAIREKAFPADDEQVLAGIKNLATTYTHLKQLDRALPLFERLLSAQEKKWGPTHQPLTGTLESLASLQMLRLENADTPDTMSRQVTAATATAIARLQRALALREAATPVDQRALADNLSMTAAFLMTQDAYTKAEPLYTRALAIIEREFGPDHIKVAGIALQLGVNYDLQSELTKALPQYLRALKIREKTLGADHDETSTIQIALASLYRRTGRVKAAEAIEKRLIANGYERPESGKR